MIVSVATADPMCTPMDKTDKAMYEETFGTDFMGCTLSMKESMTALSRMNWVTPVGGMPIVEMDHDADVDMTDMGKRKDVGMAMTAMKVAGSSVGRSGALTVSTECMMKLEPDYVYSCMAKSNSPKEFNAHLASACKKMSVRTMSTAVRADADTQATGEAIICILTSLISFFFPGLDGILDGLKDIVVTVFTVLPCPSMTR